MDFSTAALGRVIRDRRLAKHMTQDALGREAGYGAGAAVSISRIEGGRTRPGFDHLSGIAAALDRTPDQLEAEAAKRTRESRGQNGDSPSGDHRNGAQERVKDRVRRIQQEVQDRTDGITKLAGEFNEAHDRARDDFFMKFVGVAQQIEGAPQPDPMDLQDDDMTEDTTQDPEAQAAFRLRAWSHGVASVLAGGASVAVGGAAGAAVGGAAAYGTFMAAVSLGTASTGAAISGLSGAAATNAALALLGGGTLAAGGAGVAGGTMLLTAIVATPALLLAIGGGVIWMVRRNRRQQQELIEKLDKADAELTETRPGVEAVEDILPRVTKLLDYIAVHAGHALTRWEAQLGTRPLDWVSLEEEPQQHYKDFIEIAACQLSLVSINVQELMASRGEELERRIKLVREVLNQAKTTIEKLV